MSKILFFDIDGTLLNTKKELPIKTKEAIQLARQNGHTIAIATGRAPFMFKEILQELAIDTYVSLNGQVVIHNNKIVDHHPMNKDSLTKLVDTATKNNHSMVFLDENQMVSTKLEDFKVKESLESLKFPYPELKENFHLNNHVYQALIFAGFEDEEMYRENFKEFHFLRWHEHSFDVVPTGASKARGIIKLAEIIGFKLEDVFAFGDGLNDVEMLRAVGVGVAMGNGVQEAKNAADYVTKHVDEDGIYHALKHFKLI